MFKRTLSFEYDETRRIGTWFIGMVALVAMIVAISFMVSGCGSDDRIVQHVPHDALEQHAVRTELVREAQRDEFLEGLDPQDASLWSALVPFAEFDRDCNALPECTDGPTHTTRPITIVTRSRHGDVMFIAVLGIETWTPHGRQLLPRSTFYYYVGDQAGALWRMRPGATHGEVRDARLAEWRPEPTSDWVLNVARTAFITEWRRRLTESGAQEL